MSKDKTICPVFALDWRDKLIHRKMAVAATNMRHVARALREYKSGSSLWAAHASEIEGAVKNLEGWITELRKEAMEKV